MRYGLTSFILILSALFQAMDTLTAESSDSTGMAFSIFKVFTCGNVDSDKRIKRVKYIKHTNIYIYKQITIYFFHPSGKLNGLTLTFSSTKLNQFVCFVLNMSTRHLGTLSTTSSSPIRNLDPSHCTCSSPETTRR